MPSPNDLAVLHQHRTDRDAPLGLPFQRLLHCRRQESRVLFTSRRTHRSRRRGRGLEWLPLAVKAKKGSCLTEHIEGAKASKIQGREISSNESKEALSVACSVYGKALFFVIAIYGGLRAWYTPEKFAAGARGKGGRGEGGESGRSPFPSTPFSFPLPPSCAPWRMRNPLLPTTVLKFKRQMGTDGPSPIPSPSQGTHASTRTQST